MQTVSGFAALLGACFMALCYGWTYALTAERFPVEGIIGATVPVTCVLPRRVRCDSHVEAIMTRAEIMSQYRVNIATGRIQSPGKFEGEMLYVPYYWEAYLNGCADRDDGRVLGFDITPEDRAQFPELGTRRRTVKLVERSDGFVVEV